jgi:hypothetical protein
VRKVLLVLVLGLMLGGVLVGPASADPRCCTNTKPPYKPPSTGSSGPGSLPFTGLPLYLPVLLSLGLVGAGLVLRRRARESF